MLTRFYDRAFADEKIGFFFTEIVPLDLKTHLPLIADFWESVLFNTQGYRKNVMAVHQHIHALYRIEKHHLDRWLEIFIKTIDEKYEGSTAELMKQRAMSVATLMNIKLNGPQKNIL